MWKNYSAEFIKRNRASGGAIIAAAFISSIFLSFLCCFFYNVWLSEIEGIIDREGGWQGRITGELNREALDTIQNFPNVERAVINEELSMEQETAVDIYFHNMRTIFEDMPLITDKLGLESTAAKYHAVLLSRYLIHDPDDKTPPLLMTFYVIILLIVSFSLILIIHNSFASSMRARIHQFGIFSSIGATPRQILTCLMEEAAVLCAIPLLFGSFLGIMAAAGTMEIMNKIAKDIPGVGSIHFQYHPAVFFITILSCAFTVLFSAWLPAKKLSRLTPLEAVRSSGSLTLKKKKQSRILSFLFGMEGELAGNALKAQKKALRTSTLSLTLSFLGFSLMLCFFVLSGISTKYTYFERYQDVWDVMVTIKDTAIQDFSLTQEVKSLEGTRDCVVYQKASALCPVSVEWQSEELISLGSLDSENGFAKAPIIILDDQSFTQYCRQTGITPRLDGAIILNRIWDNIHSNFRYKKYIPFVKEDKNTIVLKGSENENEVQVPVLSYTAEVPVLREEYDNYALVHFMPLSLWETISGRIKGAEADTFIRILGEEEATLSRMEELEMKLLQIAGKNYEIETENRIEEKITNDYMVYCYQLLLGGFCVLLAGIGIANVFSNTLGFLTQRKRELAQYMSVGMTPAGIRKMFCIEALVIAGRPLLITIPLTTAFMAFAVKASFLNPIEFIREAPFIPMAIFSLAVFGFVALAYYIGGRRVLKCDLNETLRNDTMI